MSEAERAARRERLEALRARGIDPYPARVGSVERIRDVRDRHEGDDAARLEASSHRVAVAGRIMSQRSFGKLRFFDLVEDGVKLQVSARKGETPDSVLELLDLLDVGDSVRVEGRLWRTRTGELTAAADGLVLLAKSLRPLPEKWHGLQDVEARFRHRHLDLLVNESARRVAFVRSATVRAIRAFLDARGFLEVETPVLQPLYGGAAARPFVTRLHVFDQELYLRISDELYLKRLVVGGLDRVYEIGRDFRNEGVSRKHNPEFTMLECYQAYTDYRGMMELVESMVEHLARTVLGHTRVEYQGKAIELAGPYPRFTLREAIEQATGIDILECADFASLAAAARAKGLDPGQAPTWGRLVDHLFGEHVEPTLQQPTFMVDYPVELSPLAKRSAEDPRLVERFELFVAGMEIGNAFSELNDPDDQRARFVEQRDAARAGDDEAHPMDEDYLRALEHGLPPTGGLGVGVGRLAMVLADAPTLREVELFPHLRPEPPQ
ncbi:lysyl-tRNA synthetase, class II [Myxococcaceae bacterium]|jgi:lysyl-tRNA synthetase class 2|nr:lysyl-tRNA synthetase, class II [Myxococcaceae bacterium]